MKKVYLLATILMLGNVLNAEEIMVKRLGETVITEENFETPIIETPKNITVVTQQDIFEKGATTVAEALKGVAGLTIRNSDGAAPKFDLRGSGATSKYNTIVLLDGIPLNGLTGYNTNLIPVNEIERIEVIPSGGAVMYGDGAIGGVINIITKAPGDKINYGTIGLEAGSWDTTKANFTYGTKVTDNLFVNASYLGTNTKDYRDRNEEYKNDKDTGESIWLRGKYLLKDGNLEFRYNHNENKDYYTGSLNKTQVEDNPKQSGSSKGLVHTIEDLYILSYSKKMTDKLDLLLYGSYNESESKNQNYLVKEYYVKPQIKYTYAKNSYLIAGGDYRNGNKEIKKEVLINGVVQKAPDDERESYAGYLMNKISFGDLQLTQGFRREKVKYKYSEKVYKQPGYVLVQITPKDAEYSNNDSFELGANYLYRDTGSIYFNYTRATRTPTIGDAGKWYGDVKTQKNDVYELGIKDMFKNNYLSASIFAIESENEIYYDKIFDYSGYNRNFDGDVRRLGAQISMEHYFNKLSVRENISYIQPKVTSGMYDGKDFPGVSRWQANVGATYNFTNKLSINMDMYYMGSYYGEDDFANDFGKQSEYTTFDMNIVYAVGNGLEIYGGAKNLFDKEYYNSVITSPKNNSVAYYPADGRNIYTGFRYQF
ncbi:MAG: TonB-dependent receptor [Cetobacterium sp.]|uniref:TonB-dependent receptor n=1 Tax=Cetobacterium sp. TaxID=2071632 RepID=UPI002FC8469D